MADGAWHRMGLGAIVNGLVEHQYSLAAKAQCPFWVVKSNASVLFEPINNAVKRWMDGPRRLPPFVVKAPG
jgi:hypothetical protein